MKQVQIEGKEKINIKEIKIKNIDIIDPILYISEDNKKVINSIENKLKLNIIDNSSKKRNLQTKSKVRSIHSSLAKLRIN